MTFFNLNDPANRSHPNADASNRHNGQLSPAQVDHARPHDPLCCMHPISMLHQANEALVEIHWAIADGHITPPANIDQQIMAAVTNLAQVLIALAPLIPPNTKCKACRQARAAAFDAIAKAALEGENR